MHVSRPDAWVCTCAWWRRGDRGDGLGAWAWGLRLGSCAWRRAAVRARRRPGGRRQTHPANANASPNSSPNSASPNKISQSPNQLVRSPRRQLRPFPETHDLIQLPSQLPLIPSHPHMPELPKTPSRSNLMVVPSLPQPSMPRHHQDRLPDLQRAKDRTGSRMRHEHIRVIDMATKLIGLEKALPSNMLGLPAPLADLHEDLVTAPALEGPGIDSTHQAIEGHLRPHRHEDQRTAPRNCGPDSEARCSHWVSHRSACRPIFCPDIESSSTFAILSIQTVRARISFASRRPK